MVEEDFLDALLRSTDNVKKGNELLLKAVRTFEKQFSSGQIEGVVYNDLLQDTNKCSSNEVSSVEEPLSQ